MVVILTHPCAGKTYWAKRDKRVKSPSVRHYITGEYVFVGFGHTKYTKYDAALIIPDDVLNQYIDKRKRTQVGKYYSTHERVYGARQEVIEYAKKHGLKIYNSFEEIIK